MTGVIGVDEAGRGPVLGSMFVAAVAVPNDASLPADVDDSKRLSAGTRRAVADELRADPAVETAVVEVTPATIDDPASSLLEVVARSFASAIDALGRPDWPAVVDTGEADTGRFETRVAGHLDAEVDLRARVGADATHPPVSAASVVAKDRRERHVDELAERFGDVGSGYPSDPTTRRFLASYVERTGELPPVARRSWRTSRDVLAAAEQATFRGFVGQDG